MEQVLEKLTNLAVLAFIVVPTFAHFVAFPLSKACTSVLTRIRFARICIVYKLIRDIQFEHVWIRVCIHMCVIVYMFICMYMHVRMHVSVQVRLTLYIQGWKLTKI